MLIRNELPNVFQTGLLDEDTKRSAVPGSQLSKDLAVTLAMLGKAFILQHELTQEQRETYPKGLIALSDWSGLPLSAFNV